MDVLVIGNKFSFSRLARLAPNWSLNSTMRHLAASSPLVNIGESKFKVRDDGLYQSGEKIPWSRLAAWQLRQLGVSEMRFSNAKDDFIFGYALSFLVLNQRSARNLFSFIDLSSESGKLNFMRHPQSKPEDIYEVINQSDCSVDLRREGIKLIKSRGPLSLDRLNPAHWTNFLDLLNEREISFLITMSIVTIKTQDYGAEPYVEFLQKIGSASDREAARAISEYQKRADAYSKAIANSFRI